MKQILSAVIEEYESGRWVADTISKDAFDGSFEIGGITWSGTAVSSRLEFEKYHTKIVGGSDGLNKTLPDKFYDGSVSLQAAVGDVCRECKETFGSATPGVFLTTFERIRGPAYAALDAIAAAFGSVWWIARDGKINLKAKRDAGPVANGLRVESDTDSVLLSEPEDVEINGTYGDDAKVIRHIRWQYDVTMFQARVYFLPFLFVAPVRNDYDALHSARVDRDNGDGTIDVIVDGRFGITKIRLFSGVPGSKVEVRGGEEVTIGFFGSDPQKPFAVAMAQNIAAIKAVARVTDSVQINGAGTGGPTLITGTIASVPPIPGPIIAGPVVISLTAPILNGEIMSGSQRLKVGD